MSDIQNISFDFPIPRTHCGVPLGNGNFGMLAWGNERLHLTVNRADFWDHRDGQVVPEQASYSKIVEKYGSPDEYDEFVHILNYHQYPPPKNKSTRLPFGRFEIVFADNITPRRATLKMQEALLEIELDNGSGTPHFITLTMGIRENIVIISSPENLIKNVEFKTAQEFVADFFETKNIPPAELINEDSLRGWIQALPDDPSMAGLCKKNDDGYMICLSRGKDNQDAKSIALTEMESCEAQISEFFESIHKWWQNYWEITPSIKVPDDFLSQFYTYALYKFACATMPSSPIPSGLQGPWAEEYQPITWNGDYHFNVNIQQIYTLAFAINHPEHLHPLFNMLESEEFYSVMRQTAKRLYGVDDGLVITHAVDDLGRQVGGLGLAAVIDQACSGWTAMLYWLYYQHTGDIDFLKERAYPFIYGVMRAYEGMLEKRDGVYSIPISISAEYSYRPKNGKPVNYGPDPSYQLACIHMLLNALLEACEILNIEARGIWKDIKVNLPLYTLVEENENMEIAIWENQNLDVCHRHHSHLASIYPFDSLGELTPEKQEIIDNSITRWIAKGMGQWSEWGIPWAAIIQARMGFRESPRILLEMWKELFINEGLNTVYLPRFKGVVSLRCPTQTPAEIMQLDGTMGGASAILEMLVHCHSGVVRIFPAVSEKWQDVSFENIGIPGSGRISGKRHSGKTQEVKLLSIKGGTYRIDIPDMKEAELIQKGQSKKVSLPLILSLSPDENILLKRIS